VCSRRASESLILGGHVAVNGKSVTLLGTKINPNIDYVEVDGQLVHPQRKLYIALHKPRYVVSSCKDPQGRSTVLDLLPPELQRVYPVGRLDYDSEGLLLLTSDGEFCNKITHPSSQISKIYYVEVQGAISEAVIGKMLQGVKHEGDLLKAVEVEVFKINNTRTSLAITLHEGKTREIRRMLDTLGQIVLTLRRIQVGPVKLNKLALGKWRALTQSEINSLLNSKSC